MRHGERRFDSRVDRRIATDGGAHAMRPADGRGNTMRHGFRWVVMVLMVAGLALAACGSPKTDTAAAADDSGPAKVEHIEGSDLSRLTLTARAAERLGIQTAQVKDAQVGGKQGKVVPYGAVLYDADGKTWVYTSPKALTYVRAPIAIESIEGDQAMLTAGPNAGTQVVSVGAAELFGTEFEVGH